MPLSSPISHLGGILKKVEKLVVALAILASMLLLYISSGGIGR